MLTRDPSIHATLSGQAVRGAAPQLESVPFPLVVISHGYPGNRFLMSHLGENLASKGYVAVSIDHTDSTYDDQKAFASTLYNRPLDQLFVASEIARLSASSNPAMFLRGLVDADHTGLVGTRWGGYGVFNVIGGGFSAASETMAAAPPNRLLAERGAANPAYRQTTSTSCRGAATPSTRWTSTASRSRRTPTGRGSNGARPWGWCWRRGRQGSKVNVNLSIGLAIYHSSSVPS